MIKNIKYISHELSMTKGLHLVLRILEIRLVSTCKTFILRVLTTILPHLMSFFTVDLYSFNPYFKLKMVAQVSIHC